MKKVSLFLGMVLVAGMAMAQNTVTSTQTGHDLKATSTQTGTGLKATTTQTGQFLKATTTQVGKGLQSTIIQTNNPTQTGTPIRDKDAEVIQNGDNHYAKIYQNSYLTPTNQAKITQSGNDGGAIADKNSAEISQVGNSGSANSNNKQHAFIEQAGTKNVGNISQNGGNEAAWILQTGINNNARLTQGGGNSQGEGDWKDANLSLRLSRQEQIGNDNIAEMDQKTMTSTEYPALQYQKGNNNKAYMTGSYIIGYSNKTSQEQIGDNNYSKIIQTGSLNPTHVRLNSSEVSVLQRGNDNEATQTQGTGSSNYAKLEQLGDKNVANLSQVSTTDANSSYTILQNGNENHFTLNQTASSILSGKQDGFKNEVRLDQNGKSPASNATIDQIGNSNIIGGIDANCVVGGNARFNGDKLDVDQLGNNNKLYFNTNGNLTVNQDNSGAATKDGNTIKYTQTSAEAMVLTQVGDKNLIWFKNTSASGDLDIDQNGDGNGVALYANGFAAPATGCATFAGSHLNVDQTGNNNLLNLSSVVANASVDVTQLGNSNQASVSQQ